MYECFHCGHIAVIWDADFNADEYGYDDENGIIHACHCTHCGALITYYIPGEGGENADESGTGIQEDA